MGLGNWSLCFPAILPWSSPSTVPVRKVLGALVWFGLAERLDRPRSWQRSVGGADDSLPVGRAGERAKQKVADLLGALLASAPLSLHGDSALWCSANIWPTEARGAAEVTPLDQMAV